ncbi:hypothetical protein [Enterobacter sp. CCUG 70166]|uniref:hypothetical protein n=1 Tax=Enterobacter sp. CCUG 70166 TaxID=2028297 RepID=UPI001CDD4684|nr:hypothetical protein [Enterobacter sp. CCUG 70166]
MAEKSLVTLIMGLTAETWEFISGKVPTEFQDFAFDMSDSHKQRLATFNGI